MKKRLFFAGIICSLMLPVTVFAGTITELSQNLSDGTVSVAGTYSTDCFRPMFVLKMFNDEEIVAFVQNSDDDNSKTFEFTIPLSDEAKSGVYTVHINSNAFDEPIETELNYANPKEISEKIKEIKNMSSSEIMELIDEYNEFFGLDISVYETLNNKKRAVTYLESKSYEDVFDFQKDLLMASVIEKTNEDSKELYNLLKKYPDVIEKTNIETYELYTDLNDAKLKTFTEKMSGNIVFLDKKDFFEKFDIALILSSIKEAKVYGEVSDIMKKYENIIKTSEMSKYYTLKSTAEIDIELCGENFKTIDDLRSKTSELLKEEKPSKGNSSSGGSGGSGGYSGGISLNVPTNNDGNNTSNSQNGDVPVFSDLENVQWAKESITELAGKGVINGKGNGLFVPNDFVKREEFVKLLVSVFEIELAEYEGGFSDVDRSDWFAPYIATARKIGAVNGQSKEIFGTGKLITRQDMAVMAYNFAVKLGVVFENKGDISIFTDRALIRDYAYDAVAYLQGADVIRGLGDGTYGTEKSSTRAEAAVIIHRLLKLKGGMSQ